jgi:X-Pro dipeptidyl-peptidase (S15 family)
VIVTTFPKAVRVIEHTLIPLKDGTMLAARIWLPDDAEQNPVPAILEYLPIGRHSRESRGVQAARQHAARAARLIGATDEARLRWLLKFAATGSFDEMSASKFERRRREIHEFAAMRWSSYETADNPVSHKGASQLALWVCEGLRNYARGRS